MLQRKPTAASTEKVQAKADVTGSSDKNIAKVSPKAGDQFGEAGATYEVNVSRNDVKDAAREAVTVNTTTQLTTLSLLHLYKMKQIITLHTK